MAPSGPPLLCLSIYPAPSLSSPPPAAIPFPDSPPRRLELVVKSEGKGQRLDRFLSRLGAEELGEHLSRARLQELIASGLVLVEGKLRPNDYRLRAGQRIQLTVPAPVALELIPEPIALTILHQDADLLVIEKPAGLVVHPACGNQSGTLVHGLLYHCPDLSGINGKVRPGIVHRLDKDTSGVMVIAKNDLAHRHLATQFKDKTARKTYHALLDGVPNAASGVINAPIGRHQVNRQKMAITPGQGKEAVTRWRLKRRLRKGFSLVEVEIETGRTHQIRVHLASIGLPVAGDRVYGKKNPLYPSLGINRQCLHASTLSFIHPSTNERVSFTAELAADIRLALERLQESEGS